MDLREHENVVECIEWAPDLALENIQKAASLDSKNKAGPFLVSGSRDKTIKVHSVYKIYRFNDYTIYSK